MSEFLRRSLIVFIIQGFRTIVFVFIVIFTTFRPICYAMCPAGRWFHKLLKKQSSGICRFNPGCRRVTLQEYLTLYPVMVKGIRASYPRRFNKGRVSKFRVGPRVQQETPEEDRRTYLPKRCIYNNKDEDNSPKTLKDNNNNNNNNNNNFRFIPVLL